MGIVAESGMTERSPWASTRRSSLGVRNEQADAGRDGRPCLARPNDFAGANGDRENPLSLFR